MITITSKAHVDVRRISAEIKTDFDVINGSTYVDNNDVLWIAVGDHELKILQHETSILHELEAPEWLTLVNQRLS